MTDIYLGCRWFDMLLWGHLILNSNLYQPTERPWAWKIPVCLSQTSYPLVRSDVADTGYQHIIGKLRWQTQKFTRLAHRRISKVSLQCFAASSLYVSWSFAWTWLPHIVRMSCKRTRILTVLAYQSATNVDKPFISSLPVWRCAWISTTISLGHDSLGPMLWVWLSCFKTDLELRIEVTCKFRDNSVGLHPWTTFTRSTGSAISMSERWSFNSHTDLEWMRKVEV